MIASLARRRALVLALLMNTPAVAAAADGEMRWWLSAPFEDLKLKK